MNGNHNPFARRVRILLASLVFLLGLLAYARSVQAQTISSLSLSPTTILTPATSSGLLTLSSNVAMNTVVTLRSSNTSVATVPASVTVTSGSRNALFTVTGGNTPGTVTITATLNSSSANASLTVNVTKQLPAVTNLSLTELKMPGNVHFTWNYGTVPVAFHFLWTGTGTGHSVSLTTTSDFLDDGVLNFNTAYTYRVQAVPDDPNNLVSGFHYTSSAVVQAIVTLQQVVVTDDQTVDARYDPRYSVFTFLDHQFDVNGPNIYRGGLYAGNAANPDNSRTGRSFLRFTTYPAPAPASYLWLIASLNLYSTGALTSNTNGWTVGVQPVADNGWTSTTLTWDTAPALNPASATVTKTVTYDASHPNPGWYDWSLTTQGFFDALELNRPYSLGIAVTTEASDQTNNTNSWIYFARKEFDSTKAPCVLVAYGQTIPLINDLILTPNPVKGGNSVTGTVVLTGPVTANTNIFLTGGGTGVSFPTFITIPSGSSTGTFTITTSTVTTNTTVPINARIASQTVLFTSNLTITP